MKIEITRRKRVRLGAKTRTTPLVVAKFLSAAHFRLSRLHLPFMSLGEEARARGELERRATSGRCLPRLALDNGREGQPVVLLATPIELAARAV